ncbi:hypothetical protein BOX17_14865 [Halomonas aestuarii]|uniref:Uncharacterized protein n=1 Tax=Halomonas aestuarii TaxID=1897729 RepID=A0A1J0VJC6_9GAMM|nr:hypothetical protein [Halomonas aestuarii]APE32119.1 hypothetical protein BOX17_14865 [Halomonas aestuarii]
MAIFSGVVVAGRGMAGGHVSRHMEELSVITRQALFPGSLNVVLDKPLNLDSRCAATFDHGNRFVWEASIGRRRVWLYRWKGMPFTIVEILADCRLRDVMELVNGSRVDIAISNDVVAPLGFRHRLSSFLLWGLGRKYLYYSHRYPSGRKVMFLRKRMGDGQS